MIKERISRNEIETYKNEILEQSVLVTADDTARVLACSKRTVQRLAESGRLTAYNEKFGQKGLRFLAAELRDYVRSIKIDQDQWRE